MDTGDSYRSLQYVLRVAANTISTIIYETCETIAQEYTEEVMPTPTTPSMVGGEGCFPFEGFAWRSFRFGRLRFGTAVE